MTASIDPLDDRTLRKAWLKQKFASYEYHEEMLRLHAEWIALIYRALKRPEVQRDHPETYAMFMGPAKKNFDKAPLPGQIEPASWRPGEFTGWARSILDYGRDTGLDVRSTWDWMTDAERTKMYALWGAMAQMADNIRRTVDDTWNRKSDDVLLVERFTGPIDWPADWKDQLLGPRAAALAAAQAPRANAGEPVPVGGLWESLDMHARQQRVDAGGSLPDLGSAYGTTIWQRVSD